MLAKKLVLLRVMAGVEEALAQERDHAHERFRKLLFLAAGGVERDVLERVGLDNGFVGIDI